MRYEREFCPRCAIKHLGKAKVLLDEARLGYPHNVWFAIANMSEAEDELVDMMPAEATRIREARKLLEAHVFEFEQYVPNFRDIMMDVAREAMLEEVS